MILAHDELMSYIAQAHTWQYLQVRKKNANNKNQLNRCSKTRQLKERERNGER